MRHTMALNHSAHYANANAPYRVVRAFIEKAIENGMIIVAADSKQPSDSGNFPASMHDVISVRSLTKIDAKDQSYRDTISAPGEKILTTLPHGTYDFISGSSLSAAEVSGAIALLMEIKPNLKLQEIKSILEKSQLHSANSAFQGINANSAVLVLCETAAYPEQTLSLAVGKKL